MSFRNILKSPVLSIFVVDNFVKIFFWSPGTIKDRQSCVTKSVWNSKNGRERTRFLVKIKENIVRILSDPIWTPDSVRQEKALGQNRPFRSEEYFWETSFSWSQNRSVVCSAGNCSLKYKSMSFYHITWLPSAVLLVNQKCDQK